MSTISDVNTDSAADLVSDRGNEMSYATARKIKVIEHKLGDNWKSQYYGKSIDAIYNMVIGDMRKNLFCKIDPEIKKCLDEMVDYHDMKMSELVEKLIEEEYDRFRIVRDAKVAEMANQFTTS